MGLKLNLGDVQDANFEDLPRGDYHLRLVDGEERETSKDSQHPENPYWNLEFVVQDGKYEGRRMWINAMLPPYSPFTLKNLLRASGKVSDEALEGELDVALTADEAEDDDTVVLLNEEEPIEVIGVWGKNRKSGNMELRRFKPYDEDEWTPGDDDDELLP